MNMEGGHIKLPSNVKEATTLEDCIAIECHGSYWMLLKWRNEIIKVRITKKKYHSLIDKE
jgi:hypothetical protein